jgi:2-polyprenyl-3-methyl-5-hydroxy-6-metoxy-1,4-benzoquinol methylase/uncharacterized protein YbaR (Trm112 family)
LLESSLQYIRCIKCGDKLELETYEKRKEIFEGMLSCVTCQGQYPVILSIPLLIENLTSYFSIRTKLGGFLLLNAKNQKIKSLLKKSLQEIQKVRDDTTDLEENWVRIYKNNSNFSFNKTIKNIIFKIPKCNLVIEHGCSIGNISKILAKNAGQVYGIDKSFHAILEAKKRKIDNCDFFVADSLSHPFGVKKFDLVLALNVLELIEPLDLLQIINSQAQKFVILSTPYDYERGKNSVRTKLDEKSLRSKLREMEFKLIQGTSKPSFIPWKLKVNPRLELDYKVDIVAGRLR